MFRLRTICLIVLLLLLFPFVSAKDYVYKTIQTDLFISPDGTISVFENETFLFDGNFTYAYRNFNENGWYVTNLSIYENDLPVPYDIYYSNNRKEIRWQYEASDEERTFQLEYKVHDLIFFQKEKDTLFWTAVFLDHEKDVEQGILRVHLPESAAEKIHLEQSTPQNIDAKIINPYTIQFSTTNVLLPFTPFDVILSFPKGIVRPSFHSIIKKPFFIFLIALAVLISFLVIIGAFSELKKKGIDPVLKDKDVQEKNKLLKLTPAMKGLILKERVSYPELTATILDLAQRGYIYITEIKKFFANDFELAQLKKNTTGLTSYEKEIILFLFAENERVTLSSLRIRKNTAIKFDKIKDLLYEESEKLSLFEKNPETVRMDFFYKSFFYFALIFALIFVYIAINHSFILLFLALLFLGGFTWYSMYAKKIPEKDHILSIFLILFAIIGNMFHLISVLASFEIILLSSIASVIFIMIFSQFMPKRTSLGVRQKNECDKEKEWLKKYPLQEERMFNEFLAATIVYGIQKEWLKKYQKAFGSQEIVMPYGHFVSLSGMNSFSSAIAKSAGAGSGGSAGGGNGGGGGGGGAG